MTIETLALLQAQIEPLWQRDTTNLTPQEATVISEYSAAIIESSLGRFLRKPTYGSWPITETLSYARRRQLFEMVPHEGGMGYRPIVLGKEVQLDHRWQSDNHSWSATIASQQLAGQSRIIVEVQKQGCPLRSFTCTLDPQS